MAWSLSSSCTFHLSLHHQVLGLPMVFALIVMISSLYIYPSPWPIDVRPAYNISHSVRFSYCNSMQYITSCNSTDRFSQGEQGNVYIQFPYIPINDHARNRSMSCNIFFTPNGVAILSWGYSHAFIHIYKTCNLWLQSTLNAQNLRLSNNFKAIHGGGSHHSSEDEGADSEGNQGTTPGANEGTDAAQDKGTTSAKSPQGLL